MIDRTKNTYCKHCAERVVCVNTPMGIAWVHLPAGEDEKDSYEFCHIYRASPRIDKPFNMSYTYGIGANDLRT